MRQDVAVVGDEVAITMHTKLRRQKEIRTQRTTLYYNISSLSVTVNIVDGLPCISELISSVLSRPHQFPPHPAESHETTTGNTQQVH